MAADRRVIGLLWLAGAGLRLTILAIPPIIPLIHRDFALSATEVGLLASLPVVLFALAALPGSLLIARLGATATLVAGLLLTALGSALRGAGPSVALLYGATLVMGAGVAVMQPALPIVVREWLPRRVAFGTAVYSNGLLIGEIAPILLTLSLVLPLVPGGWRGALVFWSLPVLATAGLIAAFAPRRAPRGTRAAAPPWWPDWRQPLPWQLGVLLGSITSIYFGANAFLPDYLTSRGRPDLVAAALTALNVGQLPGSLLLLVLAQRFERRALPFVGLGALAMASLVGLVLAGGAWAVVWAALLGLACGTAMIQSLTLPALLSAPSDVGRIAAAMFAIGYGLTPIVATLCGAAWDLAGRPQMVFGPMGLCAVVLTGLPLVMRAAGRLR